MEDAFKDVIYLNHAGQAWLDPEVQKVGRQAASRPPWAMHAEVDDQNTIRQLYAKLIQAQGGEEIAIMPSTAFATTFAARNIQRLYGNNPQEQRRKILLLEDQMCSAVYPWQEICDESSSKDNGSNSNKNTTQFELDIVAYPKTDSSIGWTEAVLDRLTEGVLVVCLPPLHWSDGAVLDLKKIGKVCRDKNIIFIVDATQAVGIMPCRISEIQPAMMACSVHKWLRGPPGASLVYVHKDLHKTWIPLDQHGRSRDMADGAAWDASKDEMGPHGYPEKFFNDARKFDSGGKPNPIILPMLRKGMEQVVERVNLQTCQEQLKTTMTPLLHWALENRFVMTNGPHVYHLIGIRPKDGFLEPEQMLEIANRLQQEHKIYIAVRCGAFRIAPYLDTTMKQVEKFVDVFAKLCGEYSS